jgi:hypothetical protein
MIDLLGDSGVPVHDRGPRYPDFLIDLVTPVVVIDLVVVESREIIA